MHDCSKCFWTFHEGNQWEQPTVMSETKRKELCIHLRLQDYGNRTNRKCGGIVGLGQPAAMTCQSKLAEGGGGEMLVFQRILFTDWSKKW